jgi:hypothetical protein
LVVGACEHGELSAGVIRGVVDHDLTAPSTLAVTC